MLFIIEEEFAASGFPLNKRMCPSLDGAYDGLCLRSRGLISLFLVSHSDTGVIISILRINIYCVKILTLEQRGLGRVLRQQLMQKGGQP